MGLNFQKELVKVAIAGFVDTDALDTGSDILAQNLMGMLDLACLDYCLGGLP